MKCTICGKEITRSQLRLGDAIKTSKGYAHTDCIDDLSRDKCDAYFRKAE